MSMRDRILLFRHGLLGDTVVALPAIALLRKAFPTFRITYYIEWLPADAHLVAVPLLTESGLVDDVRTFSSSSAKAVWKLAGELIAIRKDVAFAINLEKMGWGRRRELFLWCLGIAPIFGPEAAGRAQVAHTVGQQLQMLALRACSKLGAQWNGSDGYFPELLFDAARKKVNSWKSECGHLGDGRRYLAIGSWSNTGAKRWPIERYRELIGWISRDLGLVPICIGGRDPVELNAANVVCANGNGISAVGEFSVTESYEFLKGAVAYVGNDTGAMHLAAAAGCTCIALFSARERDMRWAPDGHQTHIILRKNVPCAGCQLRECRFPEKRCIDMIDIEEVKATIVRVLGKRY